MLTEQEFQDIHDAVAEGFGFVQLPVVFYQANPSSTDDLYGEADDGDSNMTALPEIEASIRFKPDDEQLTRLGLREQADIVLFIPRANVIQWDEDNSPSVFSVKKSMEFSCYAGHFEVSEVPRQDPLPVALSGGGNGTDYIGIMVVGKAARP